MRKLLIYILIFANGIAHGQTRNVLFIGNSYTYTNSMPQIVADLAGSVGDNITYSMSCPAGYTLYSHTSNITTLNLIQQGGWDFVVLQEYSLNPSELQPYVDTYVYPSAQTLDHEINTYNPNAETVFYMTWGRKDGDATRCAANPAVCTYIGMDDLTRERYMVMAQANHAIVSPVGAVWRYIRQNYPSIELYDSDGSHPSPAGSYAAACSFYTAFFRKDPAALTFNYTLSSNDASNIRNAARLVVYDSLLTWHIGEYDPDKQAPTVPTNLASGSISTTGFTLSWSASADNVGVTEYQVFSNGSMVKAVTGTSANITGLSSATTYSMTVKAKDAAGNLSNASSALNVTTSSTVISLTISGVTANNKVYNRTTAASLNTGSAVLAGVVSGDIVTLVKTVATGAFNNRHVGSGKTVTTSGFTLSGRDAGKYTLTQPTTFASITARVLTISGVTANNRVYNGTTAATLNTGSASLVNLISGDAVSLITAGAEGTFASKNVGTGKSVTTSGFRITGTDAANYTLTQPSATGTVTTAGLTISGVTVSNKVYDGRTAATINIGSAVLAGVFGTDNVTLISTAVTGFFANKNAGSSKQVTVSGFKTEGADAGNYTLTQPSLTAGITPKTLTITANDLSKDYRSVLHFTGNEFTAVGIINGDALPSVSLSSPGTIETAHAGQYAITISGGSIPNYNVVYVPGTLTVRKDSLIATADSKTKIYGSANPQLTVTYSGFVAGENVSVLDLPPVPATSALETSDAGTYPITLSGGADDNYSFVLVDGSLEIEKADLTVKADDITRVYGKENPQLSISYSGFVLGQDQNVIDVLPVAQSDAKMDSDAGEYDIEVSGASDENYNFNYENGKLTIAKADQLIIFEPIPANLRVSQQYSLKASASSRLPVSFEISDLEIASLNGDLLSVRNEGHLTVTARQEGDGNWNQAPDVSQSIETLPTFDHISSLFTPNSDGMNDFWYIPDLEEYGKTQVTVYNRYGQIVYKSDNYKNDWDGTCNGKPLPSAAYYYIFKSSEKGFIKGVVNIVR